MGVIIATDNRAGLLPAAIDSVLVQPACGLEVIVVDDGSPAHTPKVLVRWGRRRAQPWRARETQGEFTAFLASDDRYLPGALRAHLDAFEQRPNLGLTIEG